eukprot:756521-Hanusia_phi.AAC.1
MCPGSEGGKELEWEGARGREGGSREVREEGHRGREKWRKVTRGEEDDRRGVGIPSPRSSSVRRGLSGEQHSATKTFCPRSLTRQDSNFSQTSDEIMTQGMVMLSNGWEEVNESERMRSQIL